MLQRDRDLQREGEQDRKWARVRKAQRKRARERGHELSDSSDELDIAKTLQKTPEMEASEKVRS